MKFKTILDAVGKDREINKSPLKKIARKPQM